MRSELLVFPLVGAGIGWLTNYIAIRMLFRPRRPWKIGSFTIQGLLPRRQGDLAQAIASIVEKELLPMDKLLSRLDTESFRWELTGTVVEHIESRILEGLPGLIPMNVRQFMANNLRDLLVKEIYLLTGQLSGSLTERIREEAQLGPLVEERVRELDLAQLENLILGLASRELKHIERIGAVLGFLVGVAQLLLALWLL